MARERKDKRYGRLSRSGHTSHAPRVPADPSVPPAAPDRVDGGTSRYDAPHYSEPHYAEPRYEEPRYAEPRYEEPRYHEPRYSEPRYSEPRYTEPRYVDPRRDERAYREPGHDDRGHGGHTAPRRDDSYRGEPRYAEPRYADRRYDDPREDRYPDERYPDDRPTERYRRYDPSGRPPDDTRPMQAQQEQPGAGAAALTLGRAAVTGTNRAARAVTNKVITASKANGASESGLTSLIWNQVLSYGTDAMVTVALAGTVFFGASAHAQRGNVLLYLLITMAPFAVIAPVIGPALDRLQHGRRWTMAFTGIGRAVLALVMAAHPTDLLILYPCALGSLVLSKAYGVVRAAAAPRLVPRGMTLTEANARLTIFGLGSTLVLGAVVGALIKVTGSYSAGLVLTAIGFAACAFFAFKLPKQVDSAQAAPRHPEEPARPRAQVKVPPMSRLVGWARRGFDPHVVVALQGESALRLLSGMLTIYLAFYVESTAHGLDGVLQLGLVIGAAGVGNFLGTAIGTRLRMDRPELVVVVAVCIAGVVCVLVALAFSPVVAAVGMLIASVGNALGKIALDALIQRDVVETQRSSAFGKSETFLQLAWVVGAALGVVLPSHDGDGPIGFGVAAALVLAAGVLTALRHRAVGSLAPRGPATPPGGYGDGPTGPAGSVVPRSID